MARVKGVEPSLSVLETEVLPLHYTTRKGELRNLRTPGGTYYQV